MEDGVKKRFEIFNEILINVRTIINVYENIAR